MQATLRLLADDLTGALDTAAEFVGLCGPVETIWSRNAPNGAASIAFDSGTRERDRDEAVAAVAALGCRLREGTIAYKKVDSLMRGNWAAEFAACFRAGGWRRAIVAPAFAYQGRRTEGGRQFARAADGSWLAVGEGIVESLRAEGLQVTAARPGDSLADRVTVFDATSEEDLRCVVEAARSAGESVLWCGSGGLAQALAQTTLVPTPALLEAPVLGLFGSDQAVTRAQLEACHEHWLRLGLDPSGDMCRVAVRLADTGIVLASFDLPAGTPRAEAARLIAGGIKALVAELDRPRTLFAAGGETLKALCLATGARALSATGRIVPGLPCSIMRGGRWDGVTVVSKSGAFGAKNLWRDLLRNKVPGCKDNRS
jgi:D-threonate/D-erythronate kinase